MPSSASLTLDHAGLLLVNAERLFHSLENTLLVKEAVVPQDGQKCLASLLQKVCTSARQSLRSDLENLGSSPSYEDRVAVGRKYVQAAMEIQESLLGYLSECDQYFFPPEIRWNMERVLRAVEPNVHVVLHPSGEQSPAIEEAQDLEAALLESISPEKVAEKKEDRPVYVFLSYPRAQARDVFLQTITLSHELLHFRDWHRGLSANLLQAIALNQADFDELVENLRNTELVGATPSLPPVTYGERYTEEQLRATVLTVWTNVMSRWLEELVADLLAARLFGPCYAIALADSSLAGGVINTHHPTHPRSYLRLELVLAELSQMGYRDQQSASLAVPNAQLASIRALLLNNKSQPSASLIFTKAEEYVRRQSTTLSSTVRAEAGSAAYDAQRYKREVTSLVDLLRMGVPPAEVFDRNARRSSPASIAGILNAGFAFQSAEMPRFFKLLAATDPESRLDARHKLDELLLKAIELSEVGLAWNED